MPTALTCKKKGSKKILMRIAMFAMALLVAFTALVGTTSAETNIGSENSKEIKWSTWLTEINDPADDIDEILNKGFDTYDVFEWADYNTAQAYVNSGKWGRAVSRSTSGNTDSTKWYNYTDNTYHLRSNFGVKTSFFDVFHNFTDVTRIWLTGGLASNYAGLAERASAAVDKNEALLTEKIDGSESTGSTALAQSSIYNWAKQICNKVLLPIGLVVLAFIIANRIYEAVTERNNMAEVGSGFFIQLLIQMLIAIIILTNVWTLCEWVIGISQDVISQASALPHNVSTANLTSGEYQWVFYYQIGTNHSIDMGEMLTMYMQSWILDIMMTIMQLIAWVIVEIRLIEIFFYMALAPIPLATLTDRSWGMMGRNYIKSFVALAFQGLLIFMCLGMYEAMVYGTMTGADAANLVSEIWGVAGWTLILIFTMMKTGSISKSIFDAR